MRDRAAILRGKLLETFWLSEKGWYAIALDGNKRRVDALLSSNVGHCLWTWIATDLVAELLAAVDADPGAGRRSAWP